MPNDYDKLMSLFYPLSWSKWLIYLVRTLLIFSLSVIVNSLLGLVLGALLGWLFEGRISTELALFGTKIPLGEAYKLAALIGLTTGFVASFFKFAVIIHKKVD